MIIPPPTPWRTRKKIRLVADQATPQSAEPTTKHASEIMYTGLAPNRCTAQPDTGITTASDNRYPVVTHWMVATLTWKSPLSVCRATATMVVSRIDMIVPRTTTMPALIIAGSRGLWSDNGSPRRRMSNSP